MIPEKIVNQIKSIKELRVVNIYLTKEYKFDHNSNTLYIPITETDFNSIFKDFDKLEQIELCLNNHIEKADSMFYGCESLNRIIFTKPLDLKNTSNLFGLFFNCKLLYYIDLSKIITSKYLNNISNMFCNCISLREVNFGNSFSNESVINMNSLFHNCINLEKINWTKLHSFTSIRLMEGTFYNCKRLMQLDLRGFYFNNIKDTDYMFNYTNPNLEVYVNSTFREDMLY